MAVKEIKEKSIYVCTECGYESAKWQGRCPDCGNWNTLVEETRIIGKEKKGAPAMQREASPVMALDTVNADESVRYHTGMEELDRVLGGGIVPGAAILVCGDPGIGKSTVLLQMCRTLEEHLQVLYVSGEESEQQLKMRADRLRVESDNLYVLSETDLDAILEAFEAVKPDILIADSIQTLFTPDNTSAPGSVSQVDARQHQSGARVHDAHHALGQGQRLYGIRCRPHQQGGQHRRPEGARAHGRLRAVF